MNGNIANIERLVAGIQAIGDAESRSVAFELIRTVLAFHAEGIDRMMEIAVEAGDAGWDIIERCGRDALVSRLLLLHGLHPVDMETRVRSGLEQVRPYLHSHGGNVELVEIADGTVRLRLIGSCHGCPSSSLTLKASIEKAIYEVAPDVASIQCDKVEIRGGEK